MNVKHLLRFEKFYPMITINGRYEIVKRQGMDLRSNFKLGRYEFK